MANYNMTRYFRLSPPTLRLSGCRYLLDCFFEFNFFGGLKLKDPSIFFNNQGENKKIVIFTQNQFSKKNNSDTC